VKLDWKWIGIGALIMLALSVVASLILGVMLGAQLEGITSVEEVSLSGGQIALVAILNSLAFVIGGYIVGVKSAGRTIMEPAIAAAVAVAVVLLLAGAFSIMNVIAGGLLPFLFGLLGGWLGEKRQLAAK
jgi:hypothetical protein